jgi:hypothetical protein
VTALTVEADLPVPRVTDEETGKRYYLVSDARFWSVTTAIDIYDHPGLVWWSAGLAADFAFAELPALIAASRMRPCGRTYNVCDHEWRMPHTDDCGCRRCQPCLRRQMVERHRAEAGRRADEGRRTHDVIAWWANSGGEWREHDPDITVYVESFRQFVDELGLTPESWELAEVIVINREFEYAGTLDAIIRVHAAASTAAAELVAKVLTFNGQPVTAAEAAIRKLSVLIVVDFKTREKTAEEEKFFPGPALQMTPYRRSETYLDPVTSLEAPLPATDGAVVVNLRLDGYTARPVVADDITFAAFLCALNLCRWFIEYGSASVSVRSFPIPKPAKPKTPRKRAAKKAIAAAAPASRTDPLGLRAGRGPGDTLTDDDIPF